LTRNPCGICEAGAGAILSRQVRDLRGFAYGGVSLRVVDSGGRGAGPPRGRRGDVPRKRRACDPHVGGDSGADRRQWSGGRGKFTGRHGEGVADAVEPAAVGGARPHRRRHDADLPADGISGKAFHESRGDDRGGDGCRGGGRIRLRKSGRICGRRRRVYGEGRVFGDFSRRPRKPRRARRRVQRNLAGARTRSADDQCRKENRRRFDFRIGRRDGDLSRRLWLHVEARRPRAAACPGAGRGQAAARRPARHAADAQ
jgi:hypothetical protein